MNALLEWPWRLYPAICVMALGAVFALRGGRAVAAGLKGPAAYPAQGLGLYRGFRLAVIGMVLLGLGSAWIWQITWLLVFSLILGGGETLESSIDISALRAESPRAEE